MSPMALLIIRIVGVILLALAAFTVVIPPWPSVALGWLGLALLGFASLFNPSPPVV